MNFADVVRMMESAMTSHESSLGHIRVHEAAVVAAEVMCRQIEKDKTRAAN